MKNIFMLLFLLFFLNAVNVMAANVTVDQYLDLVKLHSNDLKYAKENLALAKTDRKQALSGALPNISATAGYTRNLTENYLFVDFGEDTSDGPQKFKINRNNEYRMNLTVSQTFFNGTVLSAIKAAKEYSKLTDYIYDASYNEIITFSKKAFYQTLLLEKVWEMSKESEINAFENYDNMKNAYANGIISEFAMLQAEVRYQDHIPQTSEAKRNYEISIINLKNLAGITIDEALTLNGSIDSYPIMPATLEQTIILQNRPDYNALIWEEKLRTTGLRAEKSNYLPSLSGYFTYAFSSQSDEFQFEEKNNSYMVGLNLSIPIFSGGSTSAKVRRAKIELKKTRINIAKAQDGIKTEIQNIRLSLEESFNRIQSAKTTMTTAQKAFEIAESTSKTGLITQLELKDSRLVLDQTELNYYAAIYEYLSSYFDWEKATGENKPTGL